MAAEDLPQEVHTREDIIEKHSLDELAKRLADANVSRRGALRLLAGALLGGVLGSIPGVASAQGGRPSGAQGGCPYPGQVKVKGQCQCPSGQEICGGRCVSTSCPEDQPFNPATCACGCPGRQTVVNGECVCPENTDCTASGGTLNADCQCECPSDKPLCGGALVPPSCVSNNCPEGQWFEPNLCVCLGPCASLNGYCEAIFSTCCDTPEGPFCCPESTPEGQCGSDVAGCEHPYYLGHTQG